MKDRYIPAMITLCAGAFTCIIDIYNKVELITSLKRLLLVLFIFYIIGLIVRRIIIKTIAMKPNVQEIQEEESIDTASTDDKADGTK